MSDKTMLDRVERALARAHKERPQPGVSEGFTLSVMNTVKALRSPSTNAGWDAAGMLDRLFPVVAWASAGTAAASLMYMGLAVRVMQQHLAVASLEATTSSLTSVTSWLF